VGDYVYKFLDVLALELITDVRKKRCMTCANYRDANKPSGGLKGAWPGQRGVCVM